MLKARMLAELVFVSFDDDTPAMRLPSLFIEMLDRAAKGFCFPGVFCLKDLQGERRFTKELSLLGHHVMLRCRKELALRLEGRRKPLAKTGFCDCAVRAQPMAQKNRNSKRWPEAAALTSCSRLRIRLLFIVSPDSCSRDKIAHSFNRGRCAPSWMVPFAMGWTPPHLHGIDVPNWSCL